jgi:hypothetical protein
MNLERRRQMSDWEQEGGQGGQEDGGGQENGGGQEGGESGGEPSSQPSSQPGDVDPGGGGESA